MQNENIKVSVIIPVYNAGKYLNEGIDSLISQTLKDIEIICINDGSTDNSLAILEDYAKTDTRIKVLSQTNQGQNVARNKGLAIAKGDYISALDADDFFQPYMLEKLYSKAVATDADVVVCNYNNYNVSNGKTEFVNFGHKPDKEVFSCKDFPRYILNSFSNCLWNKLFKRSFIKENGLKFDEGSLRATDLFFSYCALAKAKKITLVGEALLNYRIGQTSNAQSSKYKFPLEFYKTLCNLKTFLIKENLFTELEQSFVNRAAETCLYNLSSQNKKTPDGLEAYNKICDFLNEEGLKNLSIAGKEKSYFYGRHTYKKIFNLKKRSAFTIKLQNIFEAVFSSKNDGIYKNIKVFGISFRFKRQGK